LCGGDDGDVSVVTVTSQTLMSAHAGLTTAVHSSASTSKAPTSVVVMMASARSLRPPLPPARRTARTHTLLNVSFAVVCSDVVLIF